LVGHSAASSVVHLVILLVVELADLLAAASAANLAVSKELPSEKNLAAKSVVPLAVL